jgi:hypothetical protein
MNDIIRYCQNRQVATYSKLVTSSNNPNITNSMRYSQLSKSSKTKYTIVNPIDYIEQSKLYIKNYILINDAININLVEFFSFIQQYEILPNVTNNVINADDYNIFINNFYNWIQNERQVYGDNININDYIFIINDLIYFIDNYNQENNFNITIDNLYIENMTTEFIKGTISVEVYYIFLKKIFVSINNNYLTGLLEGLYPLLPKDKAFYLRNYTIIGNPYGSIWPYIITSKPRKNTVNFLQLF